MRAELRNYSGSRVVLIGVAEFEDRAFPPVPAALNSLAGMTRILTDPALCGWPSDRVTVLLNPQNAGRVARHVRELGREVRDVLLLYYVGHGKLSTKGQLCLTVQDTAADAPFWTAAFRVRRSKPWLPQTTASPT